MNQRLRLADLGPSMAFHRVARHEGDRRVMLTMGERHAGNRRRCPSAYDTGHDLEGNARPYQRLGLIRHPHRTGKGRRLLSRTTGEAAARLASISISQISTLYSCADFFLPT